MPCFLDWYSQLMPDNPLHGLSTSEFRAYFFAPPEKREGLMERWQFDLWGADCRGEGDEGFFDEGEVWERDGR